MQIKRETIKDLIYKGESETVEFKRDFGDLKNALKTICSFLNSSGGCLLFGVEDDGRVVGISPTDKDMSRLGSSIENSIDPIPTANIEISKIDVDKKTLVIVRVKSGEELYHYGTVAYKRTFSQDFPIKWRDEVILKREKEWWKCHIDIRHIIFLILAFILGVIIGALKRSK